MQSRRHTWSVAEAGRSAVDVKEEVFDRHTAARKRYEGHAEVLDRLPRAGDAENVGCLSLQRRLGPFFDGGSDDLPCRAGSEVAAALAKPPRMEEDEQERERKLAGSLWTESDYVFTKPLGGPLSPNTDYHDWKRLLEDAGVRDGRLHDARHTAATVLMLLGVPTRVIDQIMGWEPGTSASMRARYLHVPDAMLKDVARKIAEAIWGPQEKLAVDKNQDNEP